MLKELSYIKLSGETLPMKMDNMVLQEIQREYGTLMNFEIKLVGAQVVTDKDGKETLKQREPDIGTANFVLPKMIREGFAVLEEECAYSDEEIIRMIDLNPYVMADTIHEEYRKCMQVKSEKKQNPDQTKKKSRLSLIGYIISAVHCWVSQRRR